MKKTIIFILCSIAIFISSPHVLAYDYFRIHAYNPNGEIEKDRLSMKVENFSLKNDDTEKLICECPDEDNIELDDTILNYISENNNLMIFTLKTDNEENPYPEINEMNIRITKEAVSGGRGDNLGKEFRLYFIDKINSTILDLSDNIIRTGSKMVEFSVDELGTYVLLYSTASYSVTFYEDKIIYDNDDNVISDEYFKVDNLRKDEVVVFPDIPQKDGYVFMGWCNSKTKGSHHGEWYLEPQPLTAFDLISVYPLWCPENEYIPLEILISTDEPIIKGKEDGTAVTLTLSTGKFSDNFPTEWCEEYNDSEYDEDKEYILNNWKQYWNISGSDELIIESVEKIDDKNVRLILSGNSSEIYSDNEIKIEISHKAYDSGEILGEGGNHYDDVYAIQLDEDGVMKNKFITDNSITLHAQKKPSRGGSLRPVEVKADTDKSSEQDKVDVTEENTDIKDTENVTDTNTEEPVSDTESSADNSAEESEKDTSPDNSIIFTIGSKTVSVSGEEKENDVAPVIRNGRTMLPARFVAEALGAVVNWDEISRTVTVTKDNIKIVITIDSQTAVVNGEEIKLDSPAFIESGRTYTPLRLIAEALGASVNWNEDTKTVTIK